MYPPGTPNSFKNQFCWRKNTFFESFGVPSGCKSILNVKILHKPYIAKLFGPSVFCFSGGSRKYFLPTFWQFCSRSLKKNLTYIWNFGFWWYTKLHYENGDGSLVACIYVFELNTFKEKYRNLKVTHLTFKQSSESSIGKLKVFIHCFRGRMHVFSVER